MKRAAAVWAIACAVGLAAAPARAQILGRGPEVSAGREAASQVEQMLPVDVDPVAVARVRAVGRRLVSMAPDRKLPYEFHVVDSPEVNAFALPGGFVYVYRGLLQLLPNEDALAFVMGHELSHATQHHGVKQWEQNMGLGLAMMAAFGTQGLMLQDTVQTLASLKWSREDEADADRHGIALMAQAGYNPDAAPDAMLVVRRSGGKDDTPALLRTHPAPDSRIRALRALAAQWKQRVASKRSVPSPAGSTVALADAAIPGRPVLLPEGVSPASSDYFPLRAGASWHYRVTGPSGIGATQVTVVEEMAPSVPGVFRVERDLGRGVRLDQLCVTTPDRVLIRPAAGAGGDSSAWQTVALFSSAGAPATGVQVEGPEPVDVPAGHFVALRVTHAGPDGRPASIEWYAPGTGLIRRQSLVTGVIEELERCSIPPAATR